MIVPSQVQRPFKLIISSVVAPNLRATGQYSNKADRHYFIKKPGIFTNAQLNEKRYLASWIKIWKLALYATNEQARSQNKPVTLISPLIGMGAYLEGQPEPIKQAALNILIKALIQAYNSLRPSHIPRIHLCAPSDKTSFSINSVILIDNWLKTGALGERCQGQLIVSQDDLFQVAHEIKRNGHHVALINPSSDLYIGGGCYRSNMEHPSSRCSFNRPGVINLRPNALEETLAQVSDFMYAQCANMNDLLTPGCCVKVKNTPTGIEPILTTSAYPHDRPVIYLMKNQNKKTPMVYRYDNTNVLDDINSLTKKEVIILIRHIAINNIQTMSHSDFLTNLKTICSSNTHTLKQKKSLIRRLFAWHLQKLPIDELLTLGSTLILDPLHELSRVMRQERHLFRHTYGFTRTWIDIIEYFKSELRQCHAPHPHTVQHEHYRAILAARTDRPTSFSFFQSTSSDSTLQNQVTPSAEDTTIHSHPESKQSSGTPPVPPHNK